ncbi:hypothetical protein, partial [Ruegeria sp. Ofav3-42]|uniref:hypothetical protein n=1 Tax=Ruegeria sp. Ofav3-42 TaxID=2917759 RepID=UPI001EF55AED
KTNAFCASVNLAAFIASVPFPSKGFVPENSNHKWQENRVSEQIFEKPANALTTCKTRFSTATTTFDTLVLFRGALRRNTPLRFCGALIP